MSNAITLFNLSADGIVEFTDKKERQHTLSGEAALFKGGEALKKLKEVALLSAYHKASAGRYRTAADILAVAFPSVHKSYMSFMACDPWVSAPKMALFVEKCEQAKPGKNGWSAKQLAARDLMNAMRDNIKALGTDRPNAVIEAA